MFLLKNGINLSVGLDAFISKSTDLFIFTPYVKLNALKVILDKYTCCKVLVVRWKLSDLLSGSSDLEVYDYCKSRGISLFFNQRLHLKAYVDNFQRCLFGSANISSRALDIPSSQIYNYELATIVDVLDKEDNLYFQTIIADSTLVTQSVYEQIKEQLNVYEDIVLPDQTLIIDNKSKNFLTSSLPMTASPSLLMKAYITGQYQNLEEKNCVLHDLALYNLPLDLPLNDLSNRLIDAFFMHPFIKAFLQMMEQNNGQVFFGEAKAWIQANCTNVPIPRRWELTTIIQILYKWIVELGSGVFIVDRPNYSERLYQIE